MPKASVTIRNPVARSPLLRKGGPHIKSKTGQRVRTRLSTNSAIDEWFDEFEDDNEKEENKGSIGSPFLFMPTQNLRKRKTNPKNHSVFGFYDQAKIIKQFSTKYCKTF